MITLSYLVNRSQPEHSELPVRSDSGMARPWKVHPIKKNCIIRSDGAGSIED